MGLNMGQDAFARPAFGVAPVEPLERRCLFATGLFEAKINFQPADGAAVSGYATDAGQTYRSQGGLTYGWATDNASRHRRRNASSSPDARYDTLAHVANTQKWEVAVPSGTFSVRLVAGDPSYLDSVHRFRVEGVTAMDATPSSANRWIDRTVTVTVNDGRLTIAPRSDAVNAKLTFVEVRQTSGPASFAGTIRWTRQSDGYAPIPRVESGVVQLGNKLYVMGGFWNHTYDQVTRRVDVLDLATRQWSRAADLPGSQTHAGAATDGRYIYWVAGQYGPRLSTQGTREGWRFDPQANRWTRFADLPQVRFGGALVHLNGRLHFFGGDDATRVTAKADHWVLNLSAPDPHWERRASMPFAGDHLSHAVHNGKIYAIGGEHDHGRTYVQHKYTLRYDPSVDAWTRLADMPTAKSHFEGSTLLINGKIYCITGQIDNQLLTDEVSVYDIAANRWTRTTAFPEKRKGAAAAYYNGKIYFSGGDSYQNGQPRELWVGEIR